MLLLPIPSVNEDTTANLFPRHIPHRLCASKRICGLYYQQNELILNRVITNNILENNKLFFIQLFQDAGRHSSSLFQQKYAKQLVHSF